jgi:hypothetical protein
MAKVVADNVDRQYAEQQLFAERKALTHLVEMYASGEWQQHYKSNTAFAAAVRERRLAVDFWVDVVSKPVSDAAPKLPVA